MPRIARGLSEGLVYHILNRGNSGKTVFRKKSDYRAFINLMSEAQKLYPIEIYGYCLMPNHFHLAVRPQPAEYLSCWMHWLMTSHVRRYHQHYKSSGHVWQGRFKSFIIQKDNYLMTVIRYIEGNPVRTGLVSSALNWPWSSHRETVGVAPRRLVTTLPIELTSDWTKYVDEPQTIKELETFKNCVNKHMPFGDPEWQQSICQKLGLESTMRTRGRPLKKSRDSQ